MSIWRPPLVWITAGAVALVFLAALQSLAVTTVMPVVSADLDGASLYAVAFSGTLATSIIGMVVTGLWCDRSSPVAPLTACVVLFVAGLVIAGTATTMPLLVVGRLVQGLGTGGQVVALYVVIARIYPPEMHGRVFAAFSAAWVVPSLVGPSIAGAVAEFLHWRWVFLGVAVLTALAYTLVALRLRGAPLGIENPRREPVSLRLICSVVVAAGALALGFTAELPIPAPLVIGVSLVLIAIAVKPLLPRGTLRVGRGLPSVVLMRGMIAGALFGAEVYVPYVLIESYGFSPVWAGLGLTAAALAWAGAADVSGRYGDRLGNRRIAALGVAGLVIATAGVGLFAFAGAPAWTIIVIWAFAGIGMGLMYPRLTVLTLAYSTPTDQGFNSAALSIFDSLGATVTIAVMGIVAVALTGTGLEFAAVFAIAAALAVASLIPGMRLGTARVS
ncbi:MFS transporter [uncultured Microbacterium sp.]|uniref:MFS transporter n=1 Tax=uncultured Microbacterium sp. TaxID=191216 RepID=UPI0025E794FF|nr:MFS transporter [uncultured Microbacterium sp.]